MCFLNVSLSVCGVERVVSSAIDDGSLHVSLNMCGAARGCLCVLRSPCVSLSDCGVAYMVACAISVCFLNVSLSVCGSACAVASAHVCVS